MDLVFKCPNCEQELEVDSSGAGQEINCPSCGKPITIPEEDSAAPAPQEEPSSAGMPFAAPEPINPIAASAAAKISRQLKVPVHGNKPAEKLIAKPPVPLTVAAKETDRQLRVKCIRHSDCVEGGQDKFDELVTEILVQIGEQNLHSVSPISYSYQEMSSQKVVTDYGVMIIYRG